MDDLRRVNEARRIPMIYVTHSHREVYTLGERAMVIDDGQVIASGSPHEVLDHPERGVVANLAGFENVFDAASSSAASAPERWSAVWMDRRPSSKCR